VARVEHMNASVLEITNPSNAHDWPANNGVPAAIGSGGDATSFLVVAVEESPGPHKPPGMVIAAAKMWP
jgi:hypothetical protein